MISLEALILILPLPSMLMSLPLMAIVPSFFMEMLADPVVMVIESPALIVRLLATVSPSSLPMLVVRPPIPSAIHPRPLS